MKVFGPVPSRRLGRSLGINNIPPKVCSYACRYCQLGSALTMTTTRRGFFAPDEIAAEVAIKLEALGDFLASVRPAVCRLSSPTRPPACADVRCCDEEHLAAATALLSERGLDVRLLNAYEGNDFVRTGDTREALLSILSVHPMRDDAVRLFLDRDERGQEKLRQAIDDGDILITRWRGATFYARNLRKAAGSRG
ncbi:MAG: hypothetical protein JMJ93_01690 [Synergistaceae bacterium]|nr:hypothetical protein [Synergistaceae bacterium]